MSPSTVGKFELRRWFCIGEREDRVGMAREGGSAENANFWTDMPSEWAKRRMRSKWRSTHISDDILPALRHAGVKEDQTTRCSCAIRARSSRRGTPDG